MPKRFCITGTCIPDKNYMVDISGRIDMIIHDYIECGQYFTINRARQFGKKKTVLWRCQTEFLRHSFMIPSYQNWQ